MDADAWRQRVSGAFQDFARLEFVAQQAVGLGDVPRVEDRSAVHAAVGRAGAEDVVDRLEDGLDTQLGATWPGGVDVSFGQWQKLALARGFVRDDPLLLVLDEPTAALDVETEHALFERYAAAAQSGQEGGRITLLVSHRFSTVRMADLIVVLDGAHVVEVGSHEQLLARKAATPSCTASRLRRTADHDTSAMSTTPSVPAGDAADRHPELPVDPDAVVPRPPHVQPRLLLAVAAGGAVGAPLRYAVSRALPTDAHGWPTATFVTNAVGALLLGMLLEGLARLGRDAGWRRTARLGLGTGVLGAFTTYSTLATEAVLLARDSEIGVAVGYGLASAALGFIAAAAGIGLAALGHRAVGGTADRDVAEARR